MKAASASKMMESEGVAAGKMASLVAIEVASVAVIFAAAQLTGLVPRTG